MKTNLKLNLYLSLAVTALMATTACSGPEAPVEEAAATEADASQVESVESIEAERVEMPVVTEEPDLVFEAAIMAGNDLIIIYEDGMTHQPAPKEGDNKSAEERNAESQFLTLYNPRFLPQAGDLSGFMLSRDFIEVDIIETTVAIIPLEETQTLIAFNKKSKFEGEVQVVSQRATGEVDHIVFTGKHHVDKYNVSAGLTGHETRKLRRELKHMTRKGQVFLYVEDSNIMYLMDSKNLATGEEVTAVEVDEMTISAVLWKDTKHHNSKGDGHNH